VRAEGSGREEDHDTVNLAAAWREQRVLLVDLDAQGSALLAFGYP